MNSRIIRDRYELRTWDHKRRIKRRRGRTCRTIKIAIQLIFQTLILYKTQILLILANEVDNIVTEDLKKPKRQEILPILDELFPDQSLDGAFEKHPLLSTTYQRKKGLYSGENNTIPTVFVPLEESRDVIRERTKFFQGLFNINHVQSVLSNPNLVHKKDFLLCKKINRDGKEWLGVLPEDTISNEEALHAFMWGGFSLVINGLQRLWGNVGRFSRMLESEFIPSYVSCNLYLTPSAGDSKTRNSDGRHHERGEDQLMERKSGFEAHWDWMDVLVVQILGEKLWSVASKPTIYLSNKDQKRKPKTDEMQHYLSRPQGRYEDFLLRPGDVMYIPRGFMHNASTIGWHPSQDDTDAEERTGDEPSLHLTFGIEHKCESTFEALLHHALEVFLVEFPEKKGESCIVHMSISEFARRESCEDDHHREESCHLRRSVPLDVAWREIFVANSNMCAEDKKDISVGTKDNFGPVFHSFFAVLDHFKEKAHLGKALDFIEQLKYSEALQSDFCIPVINNSFCPVSYVPTLEERLFQTHIKYFVSFVRNNAEQLFLMMEEYNRQQRILNWKHDDSILESLQHTARAYT